MRHAGYWSPCRDGSCFPWSSKVLAVRARYEKELRGLHEDKNRSEEEIRQQLRDEKVSTRKKGRKRRMS